MKKKLCISIVLLGIIGFLGYKISSKLSYKKEVAERTKTIPDFSFKTIEDTLFTQDSLASKPIVFVYFNSDCDYCQSEATKIQQRLADFKHTQLIFVSFEKKEGIKKFAKTYKLNNQENITFLEDVKGEFSKLFDVNSIPYIVVYDANRELLKKFKGVTKVNAILELIK